MVNSNSCTASFTQRAGIAALEGPQDSVTRMVDEFRRRRDAIVKGLGAIPGFRCSTPAGAFYAFPNVAGTGIPSSELAETILTEAGVSHGQWRFIWPAWRRILAFQLCEFVGEYSGSDRKNPEDGRSLGESGVDSNPTKNATRSTVATFPQPWCSGMPKSVIGQTLDRWALFQCLTNLRVAPHSARTSCRKSSWLLPIDPIAR